MIEAVARGGYAGTHRRRRDRPRGRVAARLLRAVREPGGVLPGHLRRARGAFPQARDRGVAAGARLVEPPPRRLSRRCSTTPPARPRSAPAARGGARRRARRRSRTCGSPPPHTSGSSCRCSGAAPDGVDVSPLTARAIVGGVRHVTLIRLRAGRERELALLAPELVDWIEACRHPLAPDASRGWARTAAGRRRSRPGAAARARPGIPGGSRSALARAPRCGAPVRPGGLRERERGAHRPPRGRLRAGAAAGVREPGGVPAGAARGAAPRVARGGGRGGGRCGADGPRRYIAACGRCWPRSLRGGS